VARGPDRRGDRCGGHASAAQLHRRARPPRPRVPRAGAVRRRRDHGGRRTRQGQPEPGARRRGSWLRMGDRRHGVEGSRPARLRARPLPLPGQPRRSLAMP
jgi:hypothetical protein